MTFSELWHDGKSFSNLFLLSSLNSLFIFMVVVMVVWWELGGGGGIGAVSACFVYYQYINLRK